MNVRPIRVIDRGTIQSAIDHEVAYDAVLKALRMVDQDRVTTPEELAFTAGNGGEIHIKGAHLDLEPWIVFKLAAGSFPGSPNAGCTLLVDGRTGEPAALLNDGGWLTEMRTAAAGAISVETLTAGGPLSVAILGTGSQARYQVAALRSVCQVRSVKIWGRSPAKTREVAIEISATPCTEIGDAVDGADVIITTTSATVPILLEQHVRPGVHVTAMGADMVGKREIAKGVFAQATHIIADDVTACARVGELQHVPEHARRAESLAAHVALWETGRYERSTNDITVADLCGIGAFDASIAAAVMTALG